MVFSLRLVCRLRIPREVFIFSFFPGLMRQVITSFVDVLGEFMSPDLVVAPWRLGYNAPPLKPERDFLLLINIGR